MIFARKLTVYIFFFIESTSFAQVASKLKVAAWVNEGNVMLRWAPDQPLAWEEANNRGYKIERVKLPLKNDKKPVFVKTVLTKDYIKPKPMMEWAVIIKSEVYAPIAAQAIFGKSFELQDKQGGISQWINKSIESEARFGFALFSADQSTILARYMGLHWVDSTVKKNERYIYKIYSAFTTAGITLDTGYVLVDAGKTDVLHPPYMPGTQPEVKRIVVSWDAMIYENIYSSWILQRSDDGGATFKSINKKPIVYVKNKEIEERNIFWSDSVPRAGFNYIYRLLGKNIFGQISPPSVTVSGFAKAVLPANPVIGNVVPIQDTKVKLNWKLDPKYSKQVRKFKVYVSATLEGRYKEIAAVDSNSREAVIDCPYLSNYFIVKAIDVYGDSYSTFAALYQPDDKSPPLAPANIKWTCDTNGRIVLSWKRNKEPDLLAYRIFRSNGLKIEFSNITSEMKKDTFFLDTVPAKTLAKKFYYKVVALDNRYNKSPYSETIIVRKPDNIPPAPPVFTKIKANDTSIYFSWAISYSNDVLLHRLMRSIDSASNYKIIFQADTSVKINFFNDRRVEKGVKYYYKIEAVDEDQNVSKTYKPAILRINDKGLRGDIEKITYEINRESQTVILKWKYNMNGVNDFQIYRYEKNGQPRLYKSVTGKEKLFTDANLRINTVYLYRIKARHTDGGSSKLSAEIEVSY